MVELTRRTPKAKSPLTSPIALPSFDDLDDATSATNEAAGPLPPVGTGSAAGATETVAATAGAATTVGQ